MTNKTITIELKQWEVNHLLQIVNAIKDLNRSTDDKTPISYNEVCALDGVDNWLARKFGMVQPVCEHGSRNFYADYSYEQLEQEDA